MWILLLIFSLAATGQDWPQHLGPRRDGTYSGPFNPATKVERLWTRALGEGFSAPVVAGGRLIAFHRQGSEEIVESMDPATGKTQWTYKYPTGYRDDFGFSEGPRAAPNVAGERVYTYGAEGTLTCVNLADGKRVWSIDARKEFGIRKEFFGTGCSPLVADGRVLMNIGGANGAGIVAMDAATGKTLWKALNSESGYASPVAATIGGKPLAVFFTREGLAAAEPATGAVRFEQRWRARMAASVNAATPLVVGSRIFLTASYGTGAILLDAEGGKLKTVWSGDDSLSAHYATPVHRDGYLYGFHGRQEMGQELRCVELATGKVMWSVDGLRAGSVTLARDHLLVVRETGELIVAPATPKGFQPVKNAKVAAEQVRSFPALSSGRLYIRTDSSLAAYRID